MYGHSRAGRDGAGIGRALCRIDAQIDDRLGHARRRHRGLGRMILPLRTLYFEGLSVGMTRRFRKRFRPPM